MKIILFVSISFLTMLYHCGSEEETTQFDYTIKIDSVVHLKSVSLKDTISLKFYGKIGSWDSEKFKKIDLAQTKDSVNVRVVGIKYLTIEFRNNTYLDGMERKIVAMQPGILHLLVQQPVGDKSLEDSIVVY